MACIASDPPRGLQTTAFDLLIVWGPGQAQEDLDAIRVHAQSQGLRVEVMETAGMSAASMEERRNAWYFEGRLGPHTQALVSAHGGAHGPDGKHHLSLAADGEPRETAALLAWLRTPPDGLPPSPRAAGWHGTAHLHSCGAGLLADELKGKPVDWNRGNFIVHGGRKPIHGGTLRTLALDICDVIAEGRKQPCVLRPAALVARAMRMAGDTIFCGGADFDAPLKIGAPRTDEQAAMDFIIESLEAGQQDAVRISGSDRDRAALLTALRSQHAEREDEPPSMEKLSNMMLTRIVRVQLEQLEELQVNHPEAHDLAMRKQGYAYGARDHAAQAVAMRRWHLAFLREVRKGLATPERLHDYLKFTSRWDYAGHFSPEWCAAIAPALRENVDLLLVGLAWGEKLKRHGLLDALRNEFSAHPEAEDKLLDAAQGDADRHARLLAFFDTVPHSI